MIKLFGSTFNETVSTLRQLPGTGVSIPVSKEDKIKVIGRMIITILLLFAAIYCLATDNKEIGGTMLGAIIGYWLK
jgi:hypothetical protein